MGDNWGMRRWPQSLLPPLVLIAATLRCGRAERSAADSSGPVSAVTRPPVAAAPAGEHLPELTWTPEPEPTQLPLVQTTVIEVAVRPSLTPVDVGAIPNFDRPRDPTPGSRTEQLTRCLSYQVRLDPTFSSSQRVRLAVRARNVCGEWIPADESWFEIVSKPVFGGGTAGREVGHFQAAIPPNSAHAETLIEIDCPAPAGGCQYIASVWSAAGGGRIVE